MMFNCKGWVAKTALSVVGRYNNAHVDAQGMNDLRTPERLNPWASQPVSRTEEDVHMRSETSTTVVARPGP